MEIYLPMKATIQRQRFRRRSRPSTSYRSPWLENLESRQMLHGSDVLAAEAAPEGEDDLVADFSLIDVNPNSASYNQPVSPRDFLGGVSAWYFGQST
jgi:hypothetical protein